MWKRVLTFLFVLVVGGVIVIAVAIVIGTGGRNGETGPTTPPTGSAAPQAGFSASPTDGLEPLTVQFTDQSTGDISDWAWYFDNDGTVDSTAQNPSHTYETAGNYTVHLMVTGPGGSNTMTKTNYITATQNLQDLQVGQSAQTSQERVTVISADRKTYYTWTLSSGHTYVKTPPAGETYIFIEVEIENLGVSSLYAAYWDFSISNPEGYRYDPQYYLGDDDFPSSQELYQGQKAKGLILFEVPEGATGLLLQYDFSDILTGPNIATWTLGF